MSLSEALRRPFRVRGETRALFGEMHDLSHHAVKEALDRAQAEKEADPSAGIFIANLDDEHPVRFGGRDYFFYGARVLSQTKDGVQPFVTPHVHLEGVEPYYFFEGTGEMNFGTVNEKQEVLWQPPVSVKQGDEFVIQEGEVHSFRNIGKKPVDFVFACPKEHLIDHDGSHLRGDRYIVSQLAGGIPEHFTK